MNPSVLFIGGMDSSGGAGLLRDCASAAALGVTARVAVTAVTAQTDRSVSAIHPVPPAEVVAQIRAAGPVRAVKIGMLGTARLVAAVAESLPDVPVVLDPVLAASSGRALLEEAAIGTLLAQLVPRVFVMTPNLPELEILGGAAGVPPGRAEADRVAALLAAGCGSVLVKGGHADPAGGICEDRLHLPGAGVVPFRGPRHPGSLRGTGCQLASGIAAGLAAGHDLRSAIAASRDLVETRFRARLAEA